MKVVVVFKWSRNPLDAIVRQDATVEWRGVKMSPSEDDPAAMELAKDIAFNGEIVALTIGDGDASWAAARGADRTVVLPEVLTSLDSARTALVLAAAIRHIGHVDAVLIGDSSWDYGIVAALAGELGWISFAGVTAVKANAEGLKVSKRLGFVNQVIQAECPAFLAVVASREEKSAPGMKDVLAARKKPVQTLSLGELDIKDNNAKSNVKVHSKGTRFPDTPPARIISGNDPHAACAELLSALSADGVL
jgi:electron transfer flavoprotein beta subunit